MHSNGGGLPHLFRVGNPPLPDCKLKLHPVVVKKGGVQTSDEVPLHGAEFTIHWPVMSPYRFSGPQCDVPRLGPGGTSNVETRGPSAVRPPEVYRRLCPRIGDVVADLPRHPARDRVAHNGGVKPPLRPRVKILWHGLPARDRSRPRWPCHAWVAASPRCMPDGARDVQAQMRIPVESSLIFPTSNHL